MSFEGSFSFKTEKLFTTRLTDGIFLRVQRAGFAVARLFFVDETSAEVPIPDGFVVIDITNGNVRVQPMLNSFFLGWTDNYTLLFRGVVVVEFLNQRQWALQGPPDRAIELADVDI
jgi:hypothetical protein